MFPSMLKLTVFAGLLLGSVAVAAEDAARTPLAKPGETYVSIEVVGCANKCPSFEIYVFDTGRMTFRSNNKYTAAKGLHYRNGMRSIYERISKYLQDSTVFAQSAECTAGNTDPSVATIQAAHDGQVEKTTFSSGCTNQIEKGRAVVKVFVNQTGMWRLIRSDTRYWEKYWENYEDLGATR